MARLDRAFLALVLALGLGGVAHGEGGDLIWAGSVGGEEARCITRDVTTDAQGNYYVLGYFLGQVDLDPGPATHLSSDGTVSMFVLKLDRAGHYLWSKTWIDCWINFGYLSFAVDAGGNICVGGYFTNTFDADPGPGTTILSETHEGCAFVLKLSSSGDFLWAKSFGQGVRSDLESRRCLAIDSSGNIFFSGFFMELSDFDPGPANVLLTPKHYVGIFLIKLDTSGNFLWGKSLDEYGYPYVTTLAASKGAEGHILVASTFRGTVDSDPGPGTAIFSAGSTTACSLVELDALGNFAGSKVFAGDWEIVPNEVCMDAVNNVYLAGTFRGVADFDPGPGVAGFTADMPTWDSTFVVKLDTSRNLSWARELEGSNAQDAGNNWVKASGVAVDASGNVFIVGEYYKPMYFNGSLVLAGATESEGRFALKLDASGNFQWTKNVGPDDGGVIESWPNVAAGADGDILATIGFYGTADFDPGPGTAILTASPYEENTALVILDGPGETTPGPATVNLTTSVSNPTTTAPVPMTATFTASVTGFEVSDLAVTNATVTNFTGSGASYTFSLVPTDAGLITVSIAAGAAQDGLGVDTLAATPFSLTYNYIDTDRDGLPDHIELLLGTNPARFDSDGDHLSDGAETGWGGNPNVYTPGVDTDPLNPDTDGDCVSDGMEAGTGHNPLLQTDVPALPLTAWDSLLTMLLIGAAYAKWRIRSRRA